MYHQAMLCTSQNHESEEFYSYVIYYSVTACFTILVDTYPILSEVTMHNQIIIEPLFKCSMKVGGQLCIANIYMNLCKNAVVHIIF